MNLLLLVVGALVDIFSAIIIFVPLLAPVAVAFDVNPVVWKVLSQRGICVRGPEPETLGLEPEMETLRDWNISNLETYWRPWAQQILSAPPIAVRLRPRWWTSWGSVWRRSPTRGRERGQAGRWLTRAARKCDPFWVAKTRWP